MDASSLSSLHEPDPHRWCWVGPFLYGVLTGAVLAVAFVLWVAAP